MNDAQPTTVNDELLNLLRDRGITVWSIAQTGGPDNPDRFHVFCTTLQPEDIAAVESVGYTYERSYVNGLQCYVFRWGKQYKERKR